MKANLTTHRVVFSANLPNTTLLTLLWAAVIIMVNPTGDFPLNDSWSYAVPVQSLLEGEGIHFTGWMSMTLVSQVLWGTLWTKLFGFSFTVLRLSTLFLSWLGVLYTYRLLSITFERQVAFWLTLIVLFNPLFLNLSFTFMTDVPFYTFALMAMYHTVRFVTEKSLLHWVFALLMVLVATFNRQLGILIPFALMLAGARMFWRGERKIALYVIPFLVTLGAYLAFQQVAGDWFNARGRFSEMNERLLHQVTSAPVAWVGHVFNKTVIALMYAALFLSPLMLIKFWRYDLKKKGLAIFMTLLFTAVLIIRGYRLPIFDNLIYNWGLGPATLYDYWFGDVQEPRQIAGGIWWGITMWMSLSFSVMVLQVRRQFFRWFEALPDPYFFLLLVLLGYYAAICSISVYDRYLLLPLPLMLVLLHEQWPKRFSTRAFAAFLMPFALYGVLGTHEYLRWNAARWDGAQYLLNKGVTPDNIDGGFEFNGWYNYNDEDFDAGLKNLWVHDVEYIITFERLPGTELVYEKTYFSMLRMQEKTIKVLRKTGTFQEMPDPYYTEEELLNAQ